MPSFILSKFQADFIIIKKWDVFCAFGLAECLVLWWKFEISLLNALTALLLYTLATGALERDYRDLWALMYQFRKSEQLHE